MNKKFLSAILFGALMVTSTGTFVSCKDYDDDIENLQTQIDKNSSAIAELQKLVGQGKWVSSISSIENGFTVTMSDGSSHQIKGINGKDGADGKNGTEWTIGEDGFWYVDGEKTENVAVAKDGKDGENGVTAPAPYINADGLWVVYTFDAEKGEFVAETTEISAQGTNAYAVKADGVYTLYIADENGELQEIALPATCDSFIVELPATGKATICVRKAEWNPAKGDKTLAALTEKFPELAELKKGDNLTQGGELPLMVNPTNVDLSKGYTFQLVDVKGNVADIALTNPVAGISKDWSINKSGNMSRSAETEDGLWTLSVAPAYDKKKYANNYGYAYINNGALIVKNEKGVSSRTAFAYNVYADLEQELDIKGNQGWNDTEAWAFAPYASSVDLFDQFTYNNEEWDAPISLEGEFEGKYLVELTNALQIEKYGLSIAEDGRTLNIAEMPEDLTEIPVALKVSAVGLNGSTKTKNVHLRVAQTVAANAELEAKSIELNGKDQIVKWAISGLGMSAVELDKVLSEGLSAEASYEWTDEDGSERSVTPATSVVFYNKEGETTNYEGNGEWENGAATEFGFVVNAKNDLGWIAPAEYTVKFIAQNENTSSVIYSAETTLTTSLPEVTDAYIRLASAFVEEGVLQVTGDVVGTKVQYNLTEAFVLKNVQISSVEDAEYDELEENKKSYSYYEWVVNSPILEVNTWSETPATPTEGWYAAEKQQLYTLRKMTANIFFFGNPLNVAEYDFELIVKSTVYSEEPTSVITMDAAKLNTYFGATGEDIAVAAVKKAVYAAGPNRGTEYSLYKSSQTGTETKKTTRNDYDAPKVNDNYLTNAAGQLIEISNSDLLAFGMAPSQFTQVGTKKFYLLTNDDEATGLYGWNTIMENMNKYYTWTVDSKKADVWEYNAEIKALKKLKAEELTAENKATLEEVAKWEALFKAYVSKIAFATVEDVYEAPKTETVVDEAIIKSVAIEAVDADEAAKYCTINGMNITPKAKNEVPVDVKDVKVKMNLVIVDAYGMKMKVPFEVSIVTEVPAE